MARKPARRDRTVTVNFKGVSSTGGGSFHIPPGDYRMRVEEVTKGVSQNDNEQIQWILKGLEGKAKGKTFYFYTPLVEQALWKLRQSLEAFGQEVPEDEYDVELDELEGSEAVGRVEDDMYRGETRSKLVGFINGEDEEEEEEEEKPAPAAKRRGKKKTIVKLSEEEVDDMSEDDLEAAVEKYDLEVDLSDHKTLRRKAGAVIAQLKEKDLLEEA